MRPSKKFKAYPFDYHQEIDVEISSLSNLGIGVAKVDLTKLDSQQPDLRDERSTEAAESGGWVVFVPHTLPGELVRARIFRNDKSHSQADLVEVLEASPERQEPKCSLFGKCGGCQYQHLDYEKQLEWKTRQVEDIGFLLVGQRSHLVDVPHCPIAMDEINEALPRIREQTRANAKAYKKDATLLLRATEGRVETNHRNPISETVSTDAGEITFHFLAGDFFQNNPFILPAFTSYVAEQASSCGAHYLVDAYCGSGLFSLCLAHKFKQVAGVEVSETAADWARRNAELNKIDNATFLAASAEAIFEDITFPANETAVVIDPPRKGCNREFLDQLFAYGQSKVVYVSCNPATRQHDGPRICRGHL